MSLKKACFPYKKSILVERYCHLLFLKKKQGFPGGEVVKNLPAKKKKKESACQCRGHGFEPLSRKIPHAAEQLSLCATATEPAHLEPVLCNKRSHCNEKPMHHNEE